MDFGQLRGAVQATLQDRAYIGEVIWCVLMSPQPELAHHYAYDALSVRSHGHVNLGELVDFVVRGEPTLGQMITSRYRCERVMWCEFLCAWALSVVHKPTDSPALSMDHQGRPMVMAWHHSAWELRFDRTTQDAVIDRVDWSVWKGVARHLR